MSDADDGHGAGDAVGDGQGGGGVSEAFRRRQLDGKFTVVGRVSAQALKEMALKWPGTAPSHPPEEDPAGE